MANFTPTESSNPHQEAANFAFNFKKSPQAKKIPMMDKFSQKFYTSSKPEYVRALAKEFDLDKLVHTEKDGKTKYFQLDSGRYNLIQECEDLSKGDPKNEDKKYNTYSTPSYFLFKNIFFGLNNTQDIKIIMDSVLKAGNLPVLQSYWGLYGKSILEAGHNDPNYRTNADWALATFFPEENKPTPNKW